MRPRLFEIALEADIRHHGADDAAAFELAARSPGARDQRQDLVAVDDAAALVAHHDAVGIAVERDAEIGARLLHLGDHRLGRGGADVLVDVETVGIDADGEDIGAQFPQRGRRDLVGGAIGAIDDDAQPFEAQLLREGALGEFDVARLRVIDAARAADLGRRGEAVGEAVRHQLFDLGFALVGELLAVAIEQLDAVVVVGIVRGRDHHAEIGAQRARQHGDGRRRQRPEQERRPCRPR